MNSPYMRCRLAISPAVGLKRNQTLWASFLFVTLQEKIYYSGDSGYGPHFKAIGEQFGPIDLAIMENGQYDQDWKYIHMMPEENGAGRR